MELLVKNTLVKVWLFLAGITALSWWISQRGDGAYEVNAVTTVGVLLIAFVKVHFVMWHFMELNVSPIWLQKTCIGWLLATAGLIFLVYGLMI